MDLSSPISILILGFLVLVFGSILRRRPTDQLQYWFFGWVLLLVHLLVGLVGEKVGPAADQITFSLGTSATILAGLSFVLAVTSFANKTRERRLFTAAVGTPALLYCNAVWWNFTSKPLLFTITSAGAAAILVFLWALYRRIDRQALLTASVLLILVLLVSTSVARGEFASGVYTIQAGLFMFSGALFHRRFRRWSIGTITASVGLLSWAGSLLGVVSLPENLSGALLLGAAWNVPAYVVALGMILTILEEQIREAAEAGKQLAHQAYHDALTGLPNRLLFGDRLSQALARARRNETRVAILCMDLDRFKQVNDTLGHHVGDLYLKESVARLNSRIRASDTLARTGGDEFTAIIGDFSSATVPAKVAESLLEALREPLMIQDCSLPLTASIGIAIFPEDASDADELCKAADQAMYRAKSRGRNRYEVFSAEVRDTLDIQEHLRKAVDQGGFEILYQPQFFRDGGIAGVEALLRFRHPRLGLVPPSRFIPIAEESGLIIPIGDWVLRQVCRQSVEWRTQADVPLWVAVNVSAVQFNRLDFADSVAQTLAATGADPSRVELELTESLVMNNVEDSSRQMQKLKRLGVHIAVDDFGTGYSSLSYLHRLPIDTLKIDRCFVEKVAEPGGTFPIVETIVSLARSLGLRTIAEGVETQAQCAIIRDLECDVIQGFLFSRPITAAAVLDMQRACVNSGSMPQSPNRSERRADARGQTRFTRATKGLTMRGPSL